MSVIEDLSEEEAYLWAILSDQSGLDQAEFTWYDPENDDGCFRAWAFQWKWWRSEAPKAIDQCARALDIDTPIPVPGGWTTMGELTVGDFVYAADGTPTKVSAVSEIFHDHECYELFFDDHTSIVADAGHLWETWDKKARAARSPNRRGVAAPKVRTTREMAETVKYGDESNHSIDVCCPLQRPELDLPLDPYFVGLWLGDGSSQSSDITTADQWIVDELNALGFEVKSRSCGKYLYSVSFPGPHNRKTQSVAAELRSLGILHDKHIPESYLRASEGQRRALLAGLMDSDGYMQTNGSAEITQKNKRIAEGVVEVLRSLGEKPRMVEKMARLNGRDVCIVHRVTWRPRVNPFRMPRKAERFFEGGRTFALGQRRVVKIEKVPSRPVRCITVDNDRHLFLAGEAMIPTHNSVGKSKSIMVRACAFPFIHPRQEMVITAPEGVHLEAITDNIEIQITSTRLLKSILNRERGKSAIKHKPFHINFANGSRIMGRIPQRDGRGVKGMHPIWLELDEGQDFPEPGWKESIETLKRGSKGAMWRAHGVTRGVRDEFYRLTQPNSGWVVHRYCLPGDTLIYGVDGPLRIDSIEPGTPVWSITREGHLVRDEVTNRIDNGVQPIWRVKTKGGYGLESTGNHPYLCLSRAKTRKTRRELKFEWIEAQNLQVGDVVVCSKSLPIRGGVEFTSDDTTRMLRDGSPSRTVPSWVWGSGRVAQEAFLAGYLIGDGSISRQKRGQDPWQVGTASETMAKELRALCHYLGYRTTVIGKNEAVLSGLSNHPQYRFYVYPGDSHFHQIPGSYSIHDLELDEHFVARTVVSVEETGIAKQTWDITVGKNHNFIAEGMVVHNTAMHRPNWTAEEREEKILDYGGSRDHPDYKRNVLGLHGDATNPLFVLHRLMACVDKVKSSEYNLDVYYERKISDEEVQDRGGLISSIIDIPPIHKALCKVFWIGMDVGFTNHPSEILVFGEAKPADLKKSGIIGVPEDPAEVSAVPKGDSPALILLTRLKLDRISHPVQVDIIDFLVQHYRPVAFSMDKTGNGLPLFQDAQHRSKQLAETIKGYNFSEKILVDIDTTVEVDEFKGDLIEDSGIRKNVLEYSSDVLRDMVDRKSLVLPFDRELLGEFEGQTYYVVRDNMNQYGKREFSKGKFHALDAAKMAVLGMKQNSIEAVAKKDKFTPTPLVFF